MAQTRAQLSLALDRASSPGSDAGASSTKPPEGPNSAVTLRAAMTQRNGIKCLVQNAATAASSLNHERSSLSMHIQQSSDLEIIRRWHFSPTTPKRQLKFLLSRERQEPPCLLNIGQDSASKSTETWKDIQKKYSRAPAAPAAVEGRVQL